MKTTTQIKRPKHDPRQTLAALAAALTGEAEPCSPFEDIAKGVENFLAGNNWAKGDAGTLIDGLIDDLYICKSKVIAERIQGKTLDAESDSAHFERALKRLIYGERK